MSATRWILTGLLILALLAPAASPAVAQPAPVPTVVTLEIPIARSSDDAGIGQGCNFSTNNNEIYFGQCANGADITSGFRFANVNIPRRAFIQDAYIRFTVDGPYIDDTMTVRFSGEANGNASTFHLYNRPEHRPLIPDVHADWQITANDPWTFGETRNSPSLRPIVQAIVNRSDWSSGNALAIITGNVGAATGTWRHRRVIGYDRPAQYPGQYAARLVVTYQDMPAAPSPMPDWTYDPASGAAAGAGDLNGDGFDDLLVVGRQNAPWTRTLARVFYGSAGGLATEPGWTLADHWQTCAAGDVNGDGFDDLFAASLDGLQVFYGSPAGPVPGTPWRGASVSLSAAGDVNGDGFDDLLAGDPFFTDGQEWEGSIALYYGSPTGPSTTPGWVLEGDATGLRLGEAVLGVGDLNGDGFDDIAALATYSVDAVLRVYLGSAAGPATTAHWQYQTWRQLSAAGVGDVDGDGFDDLLIGVPQFPCNPSGACSPWGQAKLFRGSSAGLGDIHDWRLDGEYSGDQVGWGVASAGDLNGDGYQDVAVAGSGRVLAFFGSPRGLAPEPNWIGTAGWGGLGSQFNGGSDFNGDGYDDLLAAYAAFYGSAAGPRGSRVLAQLTSQPLTIDGDLSDWPVLPGFTLDRSSAATLAGQPAAPDDAAASLRAAWDATNLYLAIHVADDVVVSDSPAVWDDDLVELGFYAVWDGNPAGGDTHQVTVNADGRVSDFGDPSVPIPVEAAVQAVEGGWDVELRIPAAYLYGFYQVLGRGLALPFNLGLRDDDDGGPWDSYLVWRGDSTTGGVDFGQIVLTAIGGPLEEPLKSDPPTRPPEPGLAPDIGEFDPGASEGQLAVLPAQQNPAYDWIAAGTNGQPAGDVNGDGFDDVINVIPDWYGGHNARLFLGSLTGLASAPGWSYFGLARTSLAITGLGDVNGDGFDDLACGHGGGAGVFFGSTAGLNQVVDWGGIAAGSAAGDVNGDGYADLLIAEPTFTNGEMYEGRLLIFFGSAAGLDRTPGWMMEGDAPNVYLGSNTRSIGDVNGDGFDDLVSGPSTAWNASNLVSILYGSPAGPLPPATAIVLEHGNFQAHGAGDVNGDGFDDLLLADPHHRSINWYPFSCGAGRLLLYLGSPNGPAATPAWTFEADRNGACLGYTAAGAGDVNGDGYADILAGAPFYDYGTAGYVFGFLGSPQGPASTPHWVSWQRGGGYTVNTAGDVNGDGHDDILAAKAGRTWRSVGNTLAFYGSAAGLAETRLFSYRASPPPTIDGDLSDWPAAPGFTLDRSSANTILGQTPVPDDAAATVRTQWDLLNLYLAIHVADDVVVSDSPSIWDDDLIELAFYAVYDGDPRGGDTHQYTINADGRVTDFGNPDTAAPIEAVARVVPGGWDVEVRIPHTSMFGFYNLYREGVVLTFNVGLRDDDDGGAWDSYLIWRGDSTTSGQRFGALWLLAP
jgi:hypothetical protein